MLTHYIRQTRVTCLTSGLQGAAIFTRLIFFLIRRPGLFPGRACTGEFLGNKY